MSPIRACLVILLLLAAAAPAGDIRRKSCGFDPLKNICKHCGNLEPAAGRSLFNFIGFAPRWVNQPGVIPNPPDRRTIITYSFAAAPQLKLEENVEPLNPAEFIGADTLNTVREGVESWNDVAGVTLQFVPSGGQIVVGAGVLAGDVAGVATFDATAKRDNEFYITEAVLLIDKTDGNWTHDSLRAVAAHETGHALGLLHTNDASALMYFRLNDSRGPRVDDRFYIQLLYGSAPAKISASTVQAGPVELKIRRAAPIQTGTDTDPLFEDGADLGTGTGARTQNDVQHYIVERRAPGESDFSIAGAMVTAPDGGQNADGEKSHAQNNFNAQDVGATASGIYAYRVRAVHKTASGLVQDILSTPVLVSVGSSGGSVAETMDTDGDGFPDAVETAAGTSPADVEQTPFGGAPADNGQLLPVAKFSIVLSFKAAGRDSFSISGTLPATGAFSPEGQRAILDIGGIVRAFTLDSKGGAQSGEVKGKIGPRSNKGLVKFSFKGARAAFAAALADEGLIDGTFPGEPRMVMATLYFAGVKYIAPVRMFYKAKAASSGKAAF